MPPIDPDMQGLSAEEIAIANELDNDGLPPEDEQEKANRETLAKPAEGEGLDPADDDNAAAAAPAPAPAPAAAVAPAPAAAPAAQAPAPAPAPEPEPSFSPQYDVDVPADAEAQIAALQTEKEAAFKQMMDGDITAEAYQAVEKRTMGEADELKKQILTAHVLATANEQQAKADWVRNEHAAFAAFKEQGQDYRANPALLAAYNVNLKALAKLPENQTKDAAWFLHEAHKKTRADLGIVTPAPAPAPAPAVQRGVDRSLLPPTLKGVPPAADPTVSGDEFGHMASLTGADAERAFAALTPEQQERYLDG